VLMCVILVRRPSGIMGGRELTLPRRLLAPFRTRDATADATAPNLSGSSKT
jgi:hypothetical protein